MFTFTPLLGAQSRSPALQSLLEFDGGIRVLVDVGWDESFDAEQLRELERQVPTISIILLTHATISHLGAYAHCCKHIPLFSQIPVYATTPVKDLGRTLIQDLYASTPLAASLLPKSSLAESAYSFPSYKTAEHADILLPPPSIEEITEYFGLVNSLKYSQLHQPIPSPWSPPLEGLTITAYCAGHTLGGTIWHIQSGTESIVYAVDWNQARENVLPGAAWLGGSGATGAEIIEQLRRPTALVCSSKGAGSVASGGGLKKRDDLLLEHIRTIIKDGGSVVIPCDASARVLELAYILERAWAAEGSSLLAAKLYLASTSCESTMKYARSMLEWMDESVMREFEPASGRASQGRRDQAQGPPPFAFKHLKLLERKSQLNRALAITGPKVFLASDSSLEWGFSKTLIQSLAADSKSLVLLTNSFTTYPEAGKASRSISDTLRKTLVENSGSEADASCQCQGVTVELRVVSTAALSGQDLPIYQQYLARQRERANTFGAEKASNLETSADVVDDGSSSTSSSSDDSDLEHQGKVLNVSAALAHSKHKLVDLTDEDLGINILLRRKNVHDYDVRGKKGREKIFPFVAKRRRNDEFGDLIRPEEYLRAEERDEVDGQDMRNDVPKGDTALGQKRRWDDKDGGKQNSRRRSFTGQNKRRRTDNSKHDRSDGANGQDGDTREQDVDSEESDYEPAEPILRGPRKATFSSISFELHMKVAAVDFSGLHDQRSLHMLIPRIRPRKLVLTGGTEEETLKLAEDCRKMLKASDSSSTKATASDVLTPTLRTTVDASGDTNAWTIKLSQSFFKRLHWQILGHLGIVTVNGRLELPEPAEEGIQKRAKLDTDETNPLADISAVDPQTAVGPPVLTDVPEGLTNSRPVSQALHVGDLRLAELRRIMQENGHTAEFKGEGTLLVDGLIAVRKSGIGKIEVESGGFGAFGMMARPSTDSFNNVKRKIYEGLAVVAAR